MDSEAPTLLDDSAVEQRYGIKRGTLRAWRTQGRDRRPRWSDVDQDRGVIVIARSWDTETKGGEPRTAPLPPELAVILKAWRKATQAKGGGLVVDRDGRPLHRGTGLARFTRCACVAAGVDPVHFHALRHTWASRRRQRASGRSSPGNPGAQEQHDHAALRPRVARRRSS